MDDRLKQAIRRYCDDNGITPEDEARILGTGDPPPMDGRFDLGTEQANVAFRELFRPVFEQLERERKNGSASACSRDVID
jgi:hypothetical protein